jgi:hypothetical protein
MLEYIKNLFTIKTMREKVIEATEEVASLNYIFDIKTETKPPQVITGFGNTAGEVEKAIKKNRKKLIEKIVNHTEINNKKLTNDLLSLVEESTKIILDCVANVDADAECRLLALFLDENKVYKANKLAQKILEFQKQEMKMKSLKISTAAISELFQIHIDQNKNSSYFSTQVTTFIQFENAVSSLLKVKKLQKIEQELCKGFIDYILDVNDALMLAKELGIESLFNNFLGLYFSAVENAKLNVDEEAINLMFPLIECKVIEQIKKVKRY